MPWDHFSCTLLKLEFKAIFSYTYFCARKKRADTNLTTCSLPKSKILSHITFLIQIIIAVVIMASELRSDWTIYSQRRCLIHRITITKLFSKSLHCWTTSGISSRDTLSSLQMFLIHWLSQSIKSISLMKNLPFLSSSSCLSCFASLSQPPCNNQLFIVKYNLNSISTSATLWHCKTSYKVCDGWTKKNLNVVIFAMWW